MGCRSRSRSRTRAPRASSTRASRRTSPCLAKALQQINYKLDFTIVAANHYDQNMVKDGGSAIQNVYMVVGFVPYEDASKNPPTQQYLDLFAEVQAQREVARGARSADLVGVAAVREGGEGVRRRPDAQMRLRQRAEGDRLDRRRAERAAGREGPESQRAAASSSRRRPTGSRSPTAGSRTTASSTATRRTCSRCNGDYSQFGKGAKLSDVGKSLDDLK